MFRFIYSVSAGILTIEADAATAAAAQVTSFMSPSIPFFGLTTLLCVCYMVKSFQPCSQEPNGIREC